MNGRLLPTWALLAVAFCLSAHLAGQEVPGIFGRYRVDIWRVQDGVRLAFTSNLVQTRDGYLWLSSQSGLTRFDGVRFKVFDGTNTPALRGRPVLLTYPLLEDGDGNLWVGTDIGLLAYADGTIRPAAVDSTFKTDPVNAATVDTHGTVWAVTRRGRVFKIPRGGGLHAVPGTIVSYSGSGIARDAAGDVWIAAGQNAVYRVHRDSLSVVALPAGVRVDDATRVYAARDSSIWLGTPTAIVQWRYGRVRRLALPEARGLGGVSCIAAASDGALWIGTHGAGLYRFDGAQFTPFTKRDGLADDRVIDILPDRSGNIWVATRDGLNRFRPLSFDVFTSHAGLPTDLPGALISDRSGALWLAPPTGGLFRGRIEAGRPVFAAADAVSNDRIAALARGWDDGVLVGRFLGSVTRFAGWAGAGRRVVEGLPPVTDILEEADGTVWIGTWRGLVRLRQGQRRSFTVDDGLPDDLIHRVYRDSHGTLWVATLTGIARAVGADERFSIQPMPQGSAERAVVLFEAPRGSLWLGSAQGLARVTGGRAAFVTTAQGLPENWIGAGEEDGAGNLWLGQLGGLTRVSLLDLAAVADGRAPSLTTVISYDALGGLPGGDPAAWPHPWSFRDPRGRLWFAMGHGIAVVDPPHVERKSDQPVMHLEEISVDGVASLGATTITLGPAVRRLELRYTGVDLTDGPTVRFRYRLDGFDTTWTDAGTQRAASYTRLAAGRYRFRVTARAGNGDWNPTEAAVDVVVLAPIYRRAWFISAVVAAVALLLWSAHRTLVRAQSDAVREERSRMAREIHDSLLQGFGGIALQLHAASARLSLPPAQQSVLDRILSLVDRTLTQARDAVWDMRLPGLAAVDLAAECEAAAQRILADSPTEARILTRGRKRRLSAACQAEYLRIVEEALTNVRRHAEAAHVVVELDYGWRRLRLTISDDGKGFDLDREGKLPGHWGLLGMRERASRIGARLTIHSQPGAGTAISVAVPYQPGALARWRSRAGKY